MLIIYINGIQWIDLYWTHWTMSLSNYFRSHLVVAGQEVDICHSKSRGLSQNCTAAICISVPEAEGLVNFQGLQAGTLQL